MPPPLSIAVSARALGHPVGGVRECLWHMLRCMAQLDHPHRITLYHPTTTTAGQIPGMHDVVLPAPHKFIWDHWILPRRLNRDAPDVVWFPQNVSSLGVRAPFVVTVYDLLYFPQAAGPREYPLLDSLYMRSFIPRTLRRANGITTNADFTVREAERILGIDPKRIEVFTLAAGNAFHTHDADQAEAVVRDLGVPQPYFFNAGTLSPRKNHRLLIEAFGRCARDTNHHLVLTGSGTAVRARFDDLIRRHQIEDRIHILGHISLDQLRALYQRATAYVFPSLYEGFGIPALEAFACGCPLLSSNAASLAEVVGDAAFTFDPTDTHRLEQGMRRVVADRAWRAQLIEAGLQRTEAFSYERSAVQVLRLIERVGYGASDGKSKQQAETSAKAGLR